MEVLVHADSSHPFWQTDLLVVLDFSPVRARDTEQLYFPIDLAARLSASTTL